MNKLLTKIAVAFVGMAMAIGVGVAVGNNSVREAKAAIGDPGDSVTWTWTTASAKKLASGANTLAGDSPLDSVSISATAVGKKSDDSGASFGNYNSSDYGGQQMGAGAAATKMVSFSLTLGNPWSGNGTYKDYTKITSVSLSGSSGASSVFTVSVTIDGADATNTNETTTLYAGTGKKPNTCTFAPATGHESGVIVFNVTNTSGNKAWYLTSISITAEVPATSGVVVSDVEDLISAIGNVEYTVASKAKIDAARSAANAYNSQEDCTYADISNYETLTTAEATYAALEAAAIEAADRAAAADVDDLIEAIGEIVSYYQKGEVEAARAAYTNLTDTQKTYVENLDVLVAAETAIGTFEPTTYTISNYDAGVQYAEDEEHELDSVVTVVTNQVHFTSELRIYNNGANQGAIDDNWVVIKSLKPINYFSANINCSSSSQYATITLYGSNDEGDNYTEIGSMTSVAGTTYSNQVADYFGDDTSYSWLKIVNTSIYQCRMKSFTITFEEVETTVGSVTVKGPNDETGSMTINSGVLGHKNIQLISDVIYSKGQGDESVTWSSSSLNNTVNSRGIVHITANENTTITVTSAEDPEVAPATIVLNISGLTNSNLAKKEVIVNTTNFGNEDAKATSENTSFSKEFDNLRFTVNRNECTSDAGYYKNNPVSFRIYTGAQLTISTVDGSLMHYVDLLSINAEFKLSSASASLSSGSFAIDGDGNTEIDLSASPVSSVTLTALIQFRFDKVDVYYEKTWNNVLLDSFTCSGVTQEHPNGAITADNPTAVWTEVASLFGQLSPEARATLKVKAASEVGDSEEQALARYDLVIRKYGTDTEHGGYEDFIGRFSEGGINYVGRNIMGVINSNSNSTATIVIIISIIGISAVGAYFMIRRRKENN